MKTFDPIAAMASARHEFGEHGGVNMSVEASTTFTVMSPETMPSLFTGQKGPPQGCYLYGRHFNPTVYALARQLSAMEGTEAAYCTASGMGAISATVMQICGHGDHAVVGDTIYGGTFALFSGYLPRRTGLDVAMVDVTDLDAVERAFTDRTKLLFVETMSNPTLKMADIPKLAEIAHRHGAKLVVDNTFCPLIVSPASHGADVVVHSLTKFISGGSDIIGGAICAPEPFLHELMDVHDGSLMLLGPTMDPHVAFQLSLRLPHLGLRMAEHSLRARTFAERLEELGVPVVYPGLPGHPQHGVIQKLAHPDFGHGGILGIELGTEDRANQLMDVLQREERFGYIAVSLGYFDTLMSVSASSTSSELSEEAKNEAGISPGYLRMSVGISGTLEQRWRQLEHALRRASVIGHTR